MPVTEQPTIIPERLAQISALKASGGNGHRRECHRLKLRRYRAARRAA